MGTSGDSLVEKYKTIKMGFDKNSSFEWWEDNSNRPELLIHQVNTANKKMAFRGHDNTPSVSFLEELRYYDFGSGESGDPVTRIMEVTGTDFLSAVKIFLSWFGEDVDIQIQQIKANYIKKETKSKKDPYKPVYLRRMVMNRSLNPKRYNLLMNGLFRGTCTEDQIKYAETVLHIGYDEGTEKYVDRLFIPEMDINGIAYGSYKYNREDASDVIPKGLLRKNSERVLFGEHMMPKYGKTIVYCEGHTDAIVNIAKRYSSITTGSATKSIGKNINKLAGKVLYDFPDLDIAGIIGATKRSIEIEEYNSTVADDKKIKQFVFLWAEWVQVDKLAQKFKDGDKERNLLLVAPHFKEKNGHFYLHTKHLSKVQDLLLKTKKKSISNTLDKYKVVFKNQFQENGFDFVDFYNTKDSKEKQTLMELFNKKIKF